MRALLVVALAPVIDDDARLQQRLEDLAVEDLVAQGPVEPLHERVLLRAALLDEGDRDSLLGQPVDQRAGDELPPIVRTQDLGFASLPEQALRRPEAPLKIRTSAVRA